MLNLTVCFLVAIGCALISCGIINRNQLRAETAFFKKVKAVFPRNKKNIVFCVVMLVYSVGLVFVLHFFYSEETLITNIKTILLASLMWPMGFIDYQSLRIPNKLILLGLIYRAIVLLFELIFFRKGLFHTVLFELIASVAVGVLLLLSLIIVKNGVGMGDIKIFMMMGLFLGVYRLISALLVIMLIALGVSLYKLIIKKEGKKAEFAFGPIIAIGSLISFIIFGN